MKRWLLRLTLLGAGLGALGFLLAASGLVSINASSGHWRVTEWVLRFSMQRSMATHSLGTDVPSDLARADLVQLGAGHYELACRSCHGEPGSPPPRVAASMLPVPPELGSRVRATNAAKLFQAVKHGIKFTGMPAWPSQQRDDEVWAMVAFLLRYPELDAPAYRRLAGRHLVASPLPVELTLGAPPAPATAQACMKCHGADGLGRDNPSMPRLAGQRAEYMAEALAAYASGKRRSGTMAVVAAELTPTARTELSRYFAQLPASPRPNSPAPQAAAATEAASLARGERLARHGVPSERVPACIECHDPAARRGKAEFPLLAGQPAAYLETQLALFRADHRGGADHAHLMQPIAARLTEEQARDVARYFASLPPRAALSPDASGADETRP